MLNLGYAVPIGFDLKKMKDWCKVIFSQGFNCLEVNYGEYLYCYNYSEYREFIFDTIKTYKPNISLHIPNLDIGYNNKGIQAEHIKQIKEMIDFADKIDCRMLILHPGSMGSYDVPKNANAAQVKELLDMMKDRYNVSRDISINVVKECAEYAEKFGITIAMENVIEDNQFIVTPEQHLQYINDVNMKNVAAVVDYAHARRGGQNLDDFTRLLGDKIVHVHVSDNDGMCDYHYPLGKGDISFSRVMKGLENINYRGNVILEVISDDVYDLMKSKEILLNKV